MDKSPDHEKDLILTVSIPPGKPGKSPALDIAKRTAIIAYISAVIAFLVKKVIYQKIKDMQPDNMPITVPDEIAFPAWGAGIAAAAIVAKKVIKSQPLVTRRNFFYISGSALGAFAGSVFADVTPGPRRPVQRMDAGTLSKESNY